MKEKKRLAKLEKEKAKKPVRPTTPPPVEKPTPTAPPPLPYQPVDPEQSFGDFMANMERFEKMRHEYHQARRAKAEAKPKPTPPPKPPAPAINIIQKPTNPYASAFNW